MNTVEAEHLVRALKPIPINEVGTSGWKGQRDAIEKLNFLSHDCAARKADDYVAQLLLSHEKLPVLIHEVLVAECWRRNVMPHVVNELLENSVGVYQYCHYEVLLVNLLECITYAEEVVVGFGDDILELLDYHWRNVTALFADASTLGVHPKARDAKEEIAADITVKFWESMKEQGVTRAMASVGCLWFIVDRLHSLPIAVSNAVLVKNDFPVGISQLLELQPWTRKAAPNDTVAAAAVGGKDAFFKFRDGQFKPCTREDSMLVTQPEAHAWFMMHYLLCDRPCRTRYQYTKWRKDTIGRIKRFLHETLVDQIPALVDVQRALEELSFIEPPSGTEEKFKSTLIIEQVPRIITAVDACLRQKTAAAIIADMKRNLTSAESKTLDAQRFARTFDALYGDKM